MIVGFRLPGNGAKTNVFGGSYLNPNPGTWNERNPINNRIRWDNDYSSVPVGRGVYAEILPMKEGGISAVLTGTNTLAGSINGAASIAATLTGTNTLTVPAYGLTRLVQLAASLTGTNSLTASINGRANMSASIKTAELSQTDVEGAILDAEIEPGWTLREVLRLIASINLGKTDITDLGGGSATVKFRDLNDTKDRITASMAGSERASVTKDAT